MFLNKKKGKIIIICGPSGVGKKTIWNEIITQDKFNIVFSVSMTTRKKRECEIDGLDYFFVSKKEFEKAIQNGEMIEWAQFANNYYGTPKKFIIDNLSISKNVFLEIEPQGVKQIIEIFSSTEFEIVSIFIQPPSIEHLKQRLLKRNTESTIDVDKRIEQAKWEITCKKYFKYCITNIDITSSKEELEKILVKELLNE